MPRKYLSSEIVKYVAADAILDVTLTFRCLVRDLGGLEGTGFALGSPPWAFRLRNTEQAGSDRHSCDADGATCSYQRVGADHAEAGRPRDDRVAVNDDGSVFGSKKLENPSVSTVERPRSSTGMSRHFRSDVIVVAGTIQYRGRGGPVLPVTEASLATKRSRAEFPLI